MLENFGVFRREDQMAKQIEIIDGLRERYRTSYVEDKGEVFNSDLTQAIELGYMLDTRARAWSPPASRARRAAAPTRARTTIPTRDDENFLQHSITRWKDGGAELSYKPSAR